MAFQTNSSIAMALAGKTASVDIPQRRSGLSGNHVPTRPGMPAMLPTPPNSISPNLPPQTFKQRVALSPGSPLSTVPQLDSDIDLEDAEHANDHHVSLPVDDLDSTGAITPAMLSKYHLPEILLQQGPLAIRHVMGHLTASARRLVVAALEGRGNGGEAGGVQGDVVFEKIGWGRWDARRRGEPARDRGLNTSSSPPSSVAGSFQQRGLQIQGQSGWQGGNRHPYRMSFAESTAFSYTDDYGMQGDLDMLEHEADKMSLDGDDGEYCSSSEAPDEIQENEWVEGDDTDEEDWAQIGADALRARSMNNNGNFINSHVAARAKPQPSGIFPATCPSVAKLPPRTFDIQERAAVEALLCLGSM
ncbi:Sin3 binding protein [Penicillium coprophilum]|uniref:Sin3 binding protein n=1 Tax=Penicillium coprophilum TaxID=36646 RepID=UPI002390B526|nr:Sin3 binding protein [Penicillium coprophilum]KAJ5163428.1 Sin3 binding protein [Penicillium coprophilum]